MKKNILVIGLLVSLTAFAKEVRISPMQAIDQIKEDFFGETEFPGANGDCLIFLVDLEDGLSFRVQDQNGKITKIDIHADSEVLFQRKEYGTHHDLNYRISGSSSAKKSKIQIFHYEDVASFDVRIVSENGSTATCSFSE